MSNLSKNSEAKFLLDGVSINAPVEWEDITINANYENDSVQPSLAVENFVFPLEARDSINQWISNGMSGGVGIFEGMPFQLTLFNNQPIQENFKAFIDFTNGYQDLPEDGKVEVSIIKDDSLDNFFEQVEGTTFGYLESIGAIGLGDYKEISYVVEKKFNMFEILMSAVILYLMIKELGEAVDRLASLVVETTAHLTGGFPAFGAIASIIFVIAKVILQLIYTLLILAAIIELAKNLFETLVPPQRTHLGVKLFTALERVCTHFGYGFSSPIAEMSNVTYLPSNPNLDEKTFAGFISSTKGTQTGRPNVIDYGYKCDEMFELAKNMFNAKIAIVNGVVILRTKNDPFWIQQSTWSLPDVLLETKQYNTDEIKPERLLTFVTDLNDEWTIDNYLGTAYEIRTTQATTIRKRAVLLKGLDEVNFRTALGSRKDELNAIERFLKDIAQVIDDVTGFLGGGTDWASKIEARLGVLKVSNNWHSIPKMLYPEGTKLPSNHRTLWNAKVLYQKYHGEKSFVLNNFYGQKTVYKGIQIPFGFEDYKQLTTNSYFLFNGKTAKITNFTWTIGRDRADIDFWVREPYTFNLAETYIEPT